jgi:two-component system cell cycle response regulator
MKILIVEDDPTSLKLTADVLQSGGHVVMLATSADQAVFSVKAVRPDVILLDLRLPGIKGLAVASQVRGESSTQNIPILAITSFSEEYGKDEAIRAGCDAYIVKPINTRTLLQEIEDVVAAKELASAAKVHR